MLGQVGLSRLGERLHSLCQPDRMSDRRVLRLAVLADGSCDDLSRVDPDPDREAEPVVAAQLAGVGGEVVLEAKGGVARTTRVVLVSNRSAEQSHDPVAGELVHRPLEAVDPLT